ncbi:uncharacterized protein LOC132639933 [Lycium barbarum]|uniref:uncharacterized protein LOC132639933 n=1 Tax=Lycium barbarum TaxID=112863 RepID=UPI00293E4802|nr:uncharacterized protein LOC132639933 [Lycium barbarum]
MSKGLAKFEVVLVEPGLAAHAEGRRKTVPIASSVRGYDFTPAIIPEVEKELLLTSERVSGIWTLYTDWASNLKGIGIGIVLKAPEGDVIRISIRTMKLTNNEAEYKAMIAGLELARSLGAKVIEAKCDSLLVVNQVNSVFKVKDERMQRYLEKTQVILHRFKEWTMQHLPREHNKEADALANLGSSVEAE